MEQRQLEYFVGQMSLRNQLLERSKDCFHCIRLNQSKKACHHYNDRPFRRMFLCPRCPIGLPRPTVNEHPNLEPLQFQNVMIPIKFTLGISKEISFKFWIDLRISYQMYSFAIIEFKVTTAYFCFAVTCNFFMISNFNQICSTNSYDGYIYQYSNYSVPTILRELLFTTYRRHSHPSIGVTINLPMNISKWKISISLFTVGWLNVISCSKSTSFPHINSKITLILLQLTVMLHDKAMILQRNRRRSCWEMLRKRRFLITPNSIFWYY